MLSACRYYDKLCHGSESVGQAAEFVTSVLNTNVSIHHLCTCATGRRLDSAFDAEFWTERILDF